MTLFIRCINATDRVDVLRALVEDFRSGRRNDKLFERNIAAFRDLEGAPFPYWASEAVLALHKDLGSVEPSAGEVRAGLQTDDDFRFVRAWWEVDSVNLGKKFPGILKGDQAQRFYGDIDTVVNWDDEGKEIKAFVSRNGDHWSRNVRSPDVYRMPGISWAQRTSRMSPVFVPSGCIPSISRYIIPGSSTATMALGGLFCSLAVDFLCKLRMERVEHPKFIVGVIKTVPYPSIDDRRKEYLASISCSAWRIARKLRSVSEASYAFVLPAALRARIEDYDPSSIEVDLAEIQANIDEIAFDLYGFSDADRAAALGPSGSAEDFNGAADTDDSDDDDDGVEAIDQVDGLLSWAVGVAFGRFDWRLATSERAPPPEPEPFDPLPAKSPGMLPDGMEPFHAHSGILVDDQGHPNDIGRLIEEVLTRVNAPVPADVRRWLQRDFFQLHVKQYSKSRRKAPIYWPISTSSGSYTLWFYYPSLTGQTLYTAVNDFIEPKLDQVSRDVAGLRTKASARTQDDEKRFEALQTLELELIELRDTFLQIAPTYRPNHDDGVQITAAPLWKLFRDKPWQKILKGTWAKLEKGEYDWAHLAIAYWPERVREKCKTDKSLAIAHDLEHLYAEPEPKAAKSNGRKKDTE